MIGLSRIRPSEISVAEKWDIISDAINAILSKSISRYSFQQVHHSVFQMCKWQYSRPLFDYLEDVLLNQLKKIRDRLLNVSNEFFLQNLKIEWDDFSLAVRHISEALLYLNNNYTSHRQTIPQIGESLFCKIVLKNEELSKIFSFCVRESLNSDLDSRKALKELSVKLLDLYKDTIYEPRVEEPIINVLIEKYRKEMDIMLNKLDTNSYILWALNIIEESKNDISNFIGQDTGKRVQQSLGLLLIKENTHRLLYADSGAGVTMVRNMDIKSLETLAIALEKVNETEASLDMIVSTAKTMGFELLTESDNMIPALAVEKVLSLRDKLKLLVERLPGVPKSDKSPVLRAITEIVNNNSDFAEKLAYYYDIKIKSKLSDEILEQVATDTFYLFRLLRSKDAFEHIFKLLLAARIINSKPEDPLTQEFFLIEKLRNECGESLVNHFETMIKDGKMRNDINKGFIRSLSSGIKLPLNFNVMVITAGVWPQYTDLPINLPDSMQYCIKLFRNYYLPHHNGRKLFFHTNLGTIFFTLNHGKTYEIAAPTSFVNTILCFQNNDIDENDEKNKNNNDEPLTLQQICYKTKLLENDALPQLESLSQMGLITINRINNITQYTFNHAFTHSKSKIYVRTTNNNKTSEDNMEPRVHRESLESSHSSNIQAALVQIMKSKKTLDHGELCKCVIEFLQKTGFVASMADIKQSLEALISKGIISRGSRPHTYIYES